MKNYILSSLLIALLFTSCLDDHFVTGKGPIVTQEIQVNDFSAIDSHGSFDVIISEGPIQKVTVTSHANIIDRLKRNVQGGVWTIELENGSYKNADLSIEIIVPSLNQAILEGSGKISLNDFKSSENVTLGIFGSGDIELNGNQGCKKLALILEGSGNVRANEAFADLEEMDINISGSGTIHAYDLNSDSAEIDIVGSGDSKVNVNSALKVRITGSGSVYYKGNPHIESNISGSGRVINDN